MTSEAFRMDRRRIAWVIVAGAALTVAVVFRGSLVAWFTGKPMAGGAASPSVEQKAASSSLDARIEGDPPRQGSLKPLPPQVFPPAVFDPISAAFVATDRARALLASDQLEGLGPAAQEVSAALAAAAEAAGGDSEVTQRLRQGAEAAAKLGQAKDLGEARHRFGELSRFLTALAASDSRLQQGWHVFSCPMSEGFNKWFQRTLTLENPYMGQEMTTCGSRSSWSPAPATLKVAGERGHEHGGDEIAYYTCSMHPSVRQETPGKCPICAMDLTPVTKEEAETGVIIVDEGRRQRIGVKTATIKEAPLGLSLRAVGRVTYDETKLEDVTLKVKGWIERLFVDSTGEPVRKGQPLFTLYSPELYAAEQEFLLALESQKAAANTGAPDRADTLVKASRQRLRLWGLSEPQMTELARRGEALEQRAFLAPVSGYVIEKNVVTGAAIEAGQRLYRIAPLHRVWVEADVYESDLPHIAVGQKATITLPYVPGKIYEGKVAYVYPYLQGNTRTGKIRIEIANPHGDLKPDMYANIEVRRSLGQRLQVPTSAIIYTGPRRLVFVDLGEGRLRPQEVKLGTRADEAYEVLEGLKAGDVVVTSGNFLIAAESRIRSAAKHWGGGGGDETR